MYLALASPGKHAIFSTLFTNAPNFMTKAKMVIYDPKTPTEKRFIPMAIGFGKDRMRQDIDIMGMLQIPLRTREVAKALHLDKVIIITRLDKKITYLCFRDLKAYCTFPIPEEFLSDVSNRVKTTQMQRTELVQVR